MHTEPVDSKVAHEGFYLRWNEHAPGKAAVTRLAQDVLGQTIRVQQLGPGWLVTGKSQLATGRAWSMARSLRNAAATPEDLDVEPLFAVTADVPRPKSSSDGPPLDCAATNMVWSLDATRTQRAWTLEPPEGGQRMGAGIRVAHPDTGYTRHPEVHSAPPAALRLRTDLGYDFEAGRKDSLDPLDGSNAHGTATASVIMSDAGGGDRFVSGVAPAAELVPLRVSDKVVHFSFRNVALAIHHAIAVEADLISMSLGGPVSSRALADAVDSANAKGLVVLAAAGNIWPWVVYPAKLPGVIAVAASNCQDRPWRKSASGSAVDICAPGESVWRAWTKLSGGNWDYRVDPSSGTSYAVASVAGACALWLAYHGLPRIRAAAGSLSRVGELFRHCLKASARTPKGWDGENYGAGILDTMALLQQPLGQPWMAKAKSAARAKSGDPLGVIAAAFPQDEQNEVVARLESLLGGTPATRKRRLSSFGAELAFHVATDAALHRALSKPKPKRGAMSLPLRGASRELLEAIGQGGAK
ncbi:MAG: S8 family serine peptidase [Planctomycetes bacterium]|nr:S8 family serine peptidase [Planctomycetota bacterium]